MERERVRFVAACLLWGAPVPALGQVFASEFFSDPVSEGWDLAAQYCDPETWNDKGWYYQRLSMDACPPGPEGGADVYRRGLVPLNGVETFFTEFRLQTDGDRSKLPYGAPALLVLGNDAGVIYHLTIARDLVQFFRAADLPVLFIELEPDVPHTFRIELYPEVYALYIDTYLIDGGVPDGAFPVNNPRISWRGRAWYLPCENAWDYIRYGRTPLDASGDYDSDGAITQDDFYFFHECLTSVRLGIHGGPGNDAGPGCRFADFDADSDTDLRDVADFQNAFTSSP